MFWVEKIKGTSWLELLIARAVAFSAKHSGLLSLTSPGLMLLHRNGAYPCEVCVLLERKSEGWKHAMLDVALRRERGSLTSETWRMCRKRKNASGRGNQHVLPSRKKQVPRKGAGRWCGKGDQAGSVERNTEVSCNTEFLYHRSRWVRMQLVCFEQESSKTS